MAARRVTQSAINWTAISERVPPTQRSNFAAFKIKSDGYVRRMMANPEAPPKIDWAFYKQTVPVAGMVENFQKQYEALKVPFPEDKVSQLIDGQEKQSKTEIEQFVKASNERIAGYQKEIEAIKSLLPFGQMTLEDFRDSYPDLALDPINRPTFWPHNEEEQPEYWEKHPELAPQDSHH